MKGIRAKLFLRIFKKIAVPTLSVGLCAALTITAMKCFGGFFDKLTIISAAAAMPQAAINTVLSQFNSFEQGVQISSQIQNEILPENQTASQTEILETSSQTVSATPPQNAGKISEYAIAPSKTSSKIIWYKNAAFSNTSKTSNASILKILKEAPTIKLTEGKPQVLIYHTHSTESYEMQDLGYYKSGSSARTTNEKYNMIRVGDEIAAQLQKAGIEVIHDRELYDYPSYNGAYNRSADAVKKYLKKYPSITVTLDIHRDAIEQSGGVRVKPTAVVNGKKAAQVMIIAGVDDGTMDFPKWKENMKFASALQTRMESDYKGLTRAAMVCHRRYNMYLTTNSLLIEVGGHANTLDEAIYSGEMIGKSLVNVLKEYGKA